MRKLRVYIGVFMKLWLLLLGICFNVFAAPPKPVKAAPVAKPAPAATLPTGSGGDWKGPSPLTEFSAGFLGGLTLNGSSAGGVILGHVAKKIMHRGLVGDDINDQVFLEVQVGPEFVSGITALGVSTHLRWDFNRDDDFALFAIGGLGAHFGTGFNQVHPRFGVGALWYFEWFGVRAEMSERWILAGAHFSF